MDVELKRKLFQSVAEELSYESKSTFQEEYSGRGMRGETTFAIVSNVPPLSVGAQFLICGNALKIDTYDTLGALPRRQDETDFFKTYY